MAITCAGATLASSRSSALVAQGETRIYLPRIATAQPTAAQQVVDLINQHRISNGCQPFTVSPQISAAAQAHSQDMALNDFVGHTGSDGSSVGRRLTRAGYNWRMVAENIAAGQSTPASVVAAWMGSAGHRANILNCSLRDIGIGFYYQADDQANVRLSNGTTGGPFRYYWTQDFGLR
ncbi:MAG TPA: CAP domain-containing protein [Roseiflexaceae bacterium]|nr:CAP domain-containing protein [Roseiflexaceae bacterium]